MTENKRTRAAFFIYSLASFTAIFTCFIVDFAINNKLTWFYIQLTSTVFAWLTASAALLSKKHKLRNAILVFTLTLFPYLFLLETSLNKIVSMDRWFYALGIPCGILLIITAWVVYFVFFTLKIRLLYRIALLTLIIGAIISPIATYFAMRYVNLPLDWTNLLNIASSILAAGVLFIIGYLKGNKS